jgi:hypothetical protein
MPTPNFHPDLFRLTWFYIVKTRHYLSASLLCLYLLLSMVNGIAQAQTASSESRQVEVPQALGPEAMESLVSKLDGEQTAALVQLMDLLRASAAQGAGSGETDSRGALEIVKQWFPNFAPT